MKIKYILLLILTFFIQDFTSAQVIKVDKVGDRAKNRAKYRKRQKEDQAIDKGLDAIEGIFKKKKKKEKNQSTDNAEKDGMILSDDDQKVIERSSDNSLNKNDAKLADGNNPEGGNAKPEVILKAYAKYDFVPGDKVIFFDDLNAEESGEFPSKWDIYKGSAENAVLGTENVIQTNDRNSAIYPYMDGNENYLPEKFTIEFDVHFSTTSSWQNYRIKLFEKDYREGLLKDDVRYSTIKISHGKVAMGDFGAELRKFKQSKELGWRHVALSYNKGYLKVYVDEEKAISIPRLKFKPSMFSLLTDHHPNLGEFSKIKNVRIAEGGDKMYDRIVTDGKYVTHGINFDYNSANIKASSFGIINKFAEMMVKYPELKFSIEGHSDSDGSETYNLELSSKRAAAVKAVLVSKGIDASRLSSVGKGEGFPLNENKTAEDKANNRRVEFIKIDS
ncbi:MAG: OmpA family protein [Bacteroidota bacterium]